MRFPRLDWPVLAAYTAAGTFIAASGATNIAYGWNKGSDLSGSIVWAAVAAAVAVVFALSWPALIRSIEARQWSAAAVSLAALVLSGAYSVTAALGSAAGGRMNAAATETATTDARAKAQAAYDRAQAELDTLTAARPAAELLALLDATKAELAKVPIGRPVTEIEAALRAAQRDPWRHGCAAINGSLGVSCPKLDAELARARQRERLTAKVASLVEDAGRAEQRHAEQRTIARTALDQAAAHLANARPAKVANADAKALTRYLAAIGVEVAADRLNDLLVLLSVLMIEAGGGLSLALAMALAATPASRPEAGAPEVAKDRVSDRTAPAAAPDAVAHSP